MKKSTVLFSASILVPALAGAQSLEAVVVTATRTENPASRVLSSVEVISGEELLRYPAADLGDALRTRAGVEVARLGGSGQQTSVFLRGTESNHVLVLVDGLRINPGTIGSAAIQNIAPELVDRIEIVKGPRSTLYGSEALGGVINVITRRDGGDGASVQAGYGRFDTRTASLAAALDANRGDLSFGASWQESDGFPTRSGDTVDRGFRNLSLTAAASADVGAVELGIRAWHASGNSEYSDFFVMPVDQDFENGAYALTASFSPSSAWHSALSAGYALDELEQNQVPDFLHTARWSIDWQNDFSLSQNQTLTAGVLWQDEDADALSFGLPYGAERTTSQFYVQDQASFGPHRLLLAAAYTDHETFGGHTTWNAEYGIEIGDSSLLTIGAGTAFRAPDATDLFGFGGNPNLDAEQSESYELGWRQQIGERQSFSLTLFRNEIDELIEFVVLDFNTFEGENRNVERARIEGAEAAWRYEAELWSARASATFQDPQNLVTDQRLLRRAEENLSFALARRIRDHEVALDLFYAGDREDFGFVEPTPLDAYWLANLSARVAIGERWTLLARMENLFDEDYELASGFNTMGRSLFVALRHEFR